MDCPICHESLDNGKQTAVLREKGCNSINNASQQLGLDIVTSPGQTVHQECRRAHCHHKDLRRQNREPIANDNLAILRSKANAFSYKDHCIFCGKPAKVTQKPAKVVQSPNYKRTVDVYPVRTFDFHKTIEDICNERKDEWAQEVSHRLIYARDLPAVEAVYHQSCSVNFRTGKQIPMMLQEPSPKMQKLAPTRGRPENANQQEAFLETIKYFEENDDEQITILDLVQKMEQLSKDTGAYSSIYMKKKLKEHYGSSIIITEINGKANVVTLKGTATSILQEFYGQSKIEDTRQKELRIIETAAKLLRNEIKDMDANKTEYPAPAELESTQFHVDFLPEAVDVFFRTMFKTQNSDVKISSIGQAVIQAVRPRVLIAPLQIGLAVQLHNQFASKYLIDVLYNLGFCSSYTEVSKFESSAAVSENSLLPETDGTNLVQFSADNVDHNLCTIDGNGTFHGMGIIASVTPGVSYNDRIPRTKPTTEELIEAGRIDIKLYKPRQEHNPIKYKQIEKIRCFDSSYALETLYRIRSIRSPVIGWSGFMQSFQDGEYPGKSSVCFLPMIDMNPSDMSCIYSTLSFITTEASKHGIVPTVTFDQPLYWKAVTIINNEPTDSHLKTMVVRLGGFHLEMSYLGSIGHIMQNSGLYELLETIYATNAVDHILSGKAVSRAVRGHLLIDTALHLILLSKMFNLKLPNEDTTITQEDCEEMDNSDDTMSHDEDGRIREAKNLMNRLLDGEIELAEIQRSNVLNEIERSLDEQKQKMHSFPTSRLWIQYMEMISILKQFIKAERTGNWELHLSAIQKMLPYFAATGHNLYLKSAMLYLQQMTDLEREHQEMYMKFMEGYHVVRRSDRYWAGLSTDLIIEQTLMRSVKTSGGMTRGKGMSELQRAKWILSMPACSSINTAMQSFENVSYQTSEQHKESTKSRQDKDDKDMMALLEFLKERDPFVDDEKLRNIETGVTATTEVNAHQAHEVGIKIVKEMDGKDALTLSFKRSMQIVQMNNKGIVKTGEEATTVSPQLLFQRLVTAANSLINDLSDVFSYELSTYPSCIFDSSGLMREPQKPQLADAIWNLGECSGDLLEDKDSVHYVVDGGWLLHRIVWPRAVTFGAICQLYVTYVVKRYPNVTVVFDGYSDKPSTKDPAHQRRNKGVTGTKVFFGDETPFRTKKGHFLGNAENKNNFIKLLSNHLLNEGVNIIQSDEDADLLIVKTAVDMAESKDTIVIGEDTDLLVLLCYHANLNSHKILFRTETKQGARKIHVWDITNTKTKLTDDTCKLLPFVHALSGCDTTSRMFGLGKGQVLKKAKNDDYFKQQADIFMSSDDKEVIAKAGTEAISCLYGGVPCEGLDLLRYRKFASKVANSSSVVEVQTLPPTSAAAKFHIYRVYLQVKHWIDEDRDLDVTDWGWSVENNQCIPIKSDQPPAPDELLKVIKCKCKTGCTKRCTCRKHGLECSSSCTECMGKNCQNSPTMQPIRQEDID